MLSIKKNELLLWEQNSFLTSYEAAVRVSWAEQGEGK